MKASNGWGPAAFALAVLAVAAPSPALAQDIGEMERQAVSALNSVPLVMQILFYVVGLAVLGVGLFKLIKNRNRPGGGSVWGAAIAFAVLAVAAVNPVLAQDIGTMAQESASALESVPLVIQILFYVVGLAVVGIGLYKLIQNRNSPGGGSVWGAVLWMSVGAIMIAIPQGLDIILGTFGIGTGGGTIQRPKL